MQLKDFNETVKEVSETVEQVNERVVDEVMQDHQKLITETIIIRNAGKDRERSNVLREDLIFHHKNIKLRKHFLKPPSYFS